MDLTVVFKTTEEENSLQVIDTTIEESYFSILELKEEAHNPTKNSKYTNRYDFKLEGIGYALSFISTGVQLNKSNNEFKIEVFRNSLTDNFNVSIKPETVFYSIEATNAIHAFITALQVIFYNTSKNELAKIFRQSWDGSILNSVYYYITESLYINSTETKFSTTKK